MPEILKNGGRQIVGPGQVQSLVEVRAQERGCGEIWAVACGLEAIDQPNAVSTQAPPIVRPVGLVEFGTVWAARRVEFDWINGLILAIPGDGLRVSVRNDAPAGMPPITCLATATLGATGRRPPVVRSFGLTNLSVLSSVPVPALAGQVEYQRADPGKTKAYFLELVDYSNQVQMDQFVAGGAVSFPMRLTNDIATVRITAAGADPPTPGRLIFWLYL